MEIIYQAFDGTPFSTEEACRAYERQTVCKMWDYLGRPTDDVSDCMVAYFPDPMSTRAFISLSKKAGVITRGIDHDDCGWFIWDDPKCEYHYIEEEIIDAFRKILSEGSLR